MTEETNKASGADVLAVLDSVARGCALWADLTVGKVHAEWSKLATGDYDEARAAVSALIAERNALREAAKALEERGFFAEWDGADDETKATMKAMRDARTSPGVPK